MPELPEVETVRRTLEPAVGAKITAVWDSGQGLHMHRKPPRKKLRDLVGARITAVRRHGKYLLARFRLHHTCAGNTGGMDDAMN